MADFKTGHAQPASFVAGAIKDGASLGLFTIKSTNTVAPGGTVEVKVRVVGGILVAVLETKLASGSFYETARIKQSQYLINIANDWLVEKTNMLTIASLVATNTQLTSLSLTDNGQIPGTASGLAIGYEQSASGVLIKTGTVTTNPDGTTTLITPDTTTTTTTSKWKKWMTYVAIGVGVVLLGILAYKYVLKK